jgi:hypothetical protein
LYDVSINLVEENTENWSQNECCSNFYYAKKNNFLLPLTILINLLSCGYCLYDFFKMGNFEVLFFK